jgi:hypothetical protein
MGTLLSLLKQRWFQIALAGFLGVTVGALFYPTKTITEKSEEKYKQEYDQKVQTLQTTHAVETKTLTDKIDAQEASYKQLQQETSSKLQKLTTENDNLKRTTHRQTYKLVKPDGTVIEKEIDDSDTESSKQMTTQIQQEFTQKISSIEQKYKTIHEQRSAELKKQYDQQLQQYKDTHVVTTDDKKTEKITEVNAKKLHIEAGMTTKLDEYLQASYSLWGPISVGAGVSASPHSFDEGRLGLGVSF